MSDQSPAAFARPRSADPEEFRNPETYHAQEGMSLRDYFAAQALPGLLVRAWGDPATGVLPSNIHAHWAAAAYATADAMLKERSK